MTIKEQLEKAIQQVIDELKEQGINVNVPLIKRRIAIFRQNFLKSIEQEKIVKKIGKTIQTQNIAQKEVEKLRKELQEIKPEIRIVKETIKEKPQIIEKTIEKEIFNSKELEELKVKFQELEKPIFHSQLSGVEPDQHHKEFHDLESHIESELMTQLKRLVSGEIVDDLHKHIYKKVEQQIIGYAGMTQNDADKRYLNLDQTTPQTIANGIPLMTASVVGTGSEYQLVNKEYVDLAVSALELTEYFYDNASDIGGIYYVMDDTPDTIGTVVKSGLSAGNNQAMFNFATLSGKPHLDRLLAGVYDCHFHAYVSNVPSKTVVVYYELYKRTSGGVETLLSTSETSSALTTTSTEQNIHCVITTEETLDTTDRLVIKWYANVSGGGGTVDITFDTGGTKNSHFSIKVSAVELSSLFVPYTGATTDVDLGVYKITATNVIDSGLTASKVVFTDASKQLTSTGIGTSSQFIKGDGSLDSSTYLTAEADTLASVMGRGATTGVQLTSTLASGTSPFAITSTTVNTNLNADLWDGYQFSDYLDQAVKTTSSPTFANITDSGLTANRIPYASTGGLLADSAFYTNATGQIGLRVAANSSRGFYVDDATACAAGGTTTFFIKDDITASETNTGLHTGIYLDIILDGAQNYTRTAGAGGMAVLSMIGRSYTSGTTSAATLGYFGWEQKTGTTTTLNYFNLNAPTITSGTIGTLNGLVMGTLKATGVTTANAITCNDGLVVFNEIGSSYSDVRIEGDTNVNLFFTDASADAIGIGTASPTVQLHQTGNFRTGGAFVFTLTASASSVAVTFPVAFPASTTPVVVCTPPYSTSFWVTSITNTGFTFNVGTTNAYNQTINGMAFLAA
jgi:hypothetical protein